MSNLWRKDFLGLNQRVHDKPLIYLDNAATTQKPQSVIRETTNYYQNYCTSINRSAHYLCEKVTNLYEETRSLTASFINASSSEIIFVNGTTHGINLISHALGKNYFKPDDEIILTIMEHHANIVPWLMLKEELNINLKIVPLTSEQTLDLKVYEGLFNKNTRLVAFCHASNVLGVINPASEMIDIAKKFSVPTLVDAAQSIAHLDIDVKKIGCDFLVFSAHKIFGPTGVGVLYMTPYWQERLSPLMTGGDMIQSVSFDRATFALGYKKFEAGTPNIAGVLGFGAALKYINNLNKEEILNHEKDLHDYAYKSLSSLKNIKIFGPRDKKISLISFVVDDVHPHDVSSILDSDGIAIRTGLLCAEPLVRSLGYMAVCRASFAFYNLKEEVDILIKGLEKVLRIFKQ